MTGRLVRTTAAVAALLSVIATGLGAQAPEPARHALSLNPLGIPFEWFSLEYEGRVNSSFTLGVSGSYFGPDDDSYTSVDLKARLYPSERALRGFSVGLSAGFTRLEEDQCGAFGEECSESSPTIGVTVDYNWLLGPRQRFFVGLGTGAKRLLGADGDDFDDLLVAYPTVRFQIGYAFR